MECQILGRADPLFPLCLARSGFHLYASEYPAAPRGKGILADPLIGEINLARQRPSLGRKHFVRKNDRAYGAARSLWQRLYYQFCQASTPNGPPKRSPDEFLTAGSKWPLVICIVGV